MPFYPTPTGQQNPTLAEMRITAGTSLPDAVAILNGAGYDGAAFQSWYAAAVKKDPSLSPYNGVLIWLTGGGIAKGVQSGVTGTAAATNQVTTGTVKGAIQAEKTLNPLSFSWLAGITGFSGTNFVLRAIKVLIGGTLLMVGIVHLAGIDSGKVAQIARKVPIPV